MFHNDATIQERIEQLAKEPDLLARFARDIDGIGVVGDPHLLKAIFLILTSRILEKPVSLLVKGPSSAGKSYAVEQVSRFFPADAVYSLTGMSDKVLAYDREPLSHRMLLIYEACGLQGGSAEYMLRSLISEGHIRYAVTETQGDGQLGVTHIERAGPTGVIMTTTDIAIKADNENRMLSLTVSDSPDHTSAIMLALGRRYSGELSDASCDWEAWRGLQALLAEGDNRVLIPYGPAVARLIRPTSLRLRRDFSLFMSLVQTHALLHSASRQRDEAGCVIATIDDYAQVRALVGPAMQEMIKARVSDSASETVAAVRALTGTGQPTTTGAVAARLGIDKGAASRRIQAAIQNGWLVNYSRARNATKLMPGDPLPDELPLWPEPERVGEYKMEGETLPEPPPVAPPARRGSEWIHSERQIVQPVLPH